MKILTFKHQPHRMVKYTETICRQQPTNCLSVFDHVFFGGGGIMLTGLQWSKDFALVSISDLFIMNYLSEFLNSLSITLNKHLCIKYV